MTDALKDFVALEEPDEMGSSGWYVGCVDNIQYDEYYLHDDGVVYHTCAAQFNAQGDQVSTGWFASEVEAYIQIRMYYNKHGIKPVAGANKTDSQVMEFI